MGRVHSVDSASDKAIVVVGNSLKNYRMGDLKVVSYEPVTKHLRPEFFPHPQAKTSGIILLDEINRARPDTRAAMFDFLLYRRIVKYILPPGWHLACAMNPAIDGYHVEELDRALMDRLTFINFNPTTKDWLDYETGNGYEDSPVLTFIRENPKALDANEPKFSIDQRESRRSWSSVVRIESDPTVPEELKLELYTGIVGSDIVTGKQIGRAHV